MKKSYYRLFSYLVTVLFLFYWLGVFILAMPSNYANEKITNYFPRFKTIFTSSWRLFSPPYTNHNRLYYIVRNVKEPGRTDTIEVLEQISKNKQIAAPFNQRENIIDCCVSNNVSGLIKTIWKNKKKPTTGTTDSLFLVNAINEVINNRKYIICLGTLSNYAKIALKENNIDTTGKEVKIVIKEKMIRPFQEINNPNFVSAETLVFETPYQPIQP